jgi:hypothetical protein
VRELVYHELSEEEKGRILRAIAKRLARESNIVFAYVHGGFVRRRFFRDVDVAVRLKAPLPFKYRVMSEGKLLFSRDEKLRKELVNAIVREYLDFQYFSSLHSRRSSQG